MSNKYCLIISGPSGSGKTNLANELWKTLPDNPAYLCLDSIRHFTRGSVGNDHYLDLARKNALSMAKNFLQAGHSVIVEKSFGSYEFVRPFRDMAKKFLVEAPYFKLSAPLEVLIERVESRKLFSAEELIERAEWLRSSGNAETVRRIYEFFRKNAHEEGIELDSSKHTTKELANIVKGYL